MTDGPAKTPPPDWFNRAVSTPFETHAVDVEDCRINYFVWPAKPEVEAPGGLLFVHGGGAHAHWWSFIAPFFTDRFRVAALDMSGMGDSGRRTRYEAAIWAREMRAVIAAADLGEKPFVVGHSFGGFMTMKFGSEYGDEVDGVVIVDSPVRPPRPKDARDAPRKPRDWANKRVYPDFKTALARFRLMPPQACANDYLVEHIGRHSLARTEEGWTWKFDPDAMGLRRFGEPFHEFLQAVSCRAALIYGQRSELVSRKTADYMASLMGPQAPIIEIPDAAHHLTLDQPLAFVAALNTLLEVWQKS